MICNDETWVKCILKCVKDTRNMEDFDYQRVVFKHSVFPYEDMEDVLNDICRLNPSLNENYEHIEIAQVFFISLNDLLDGKE